MEGANGPVQMQRYSRDVPVSSLFPPLAPARSHHGNTGRKRKNRKVWRDEGERQKELRATSITSEQGEQVTNGLVTNCHAVVTGREFLFLLAIESGA